MAGDIERVYGEIGERVAKLRDERGFTQEQLAERAGISANHLAKVERAFKRSTVATLAQVAKALGVPLAALVSEEGKEGASVPGLVEVLTTLPKDDQRAILRLAEHFVKVRSSSASPEGSKRHRAHSRR
ncbi:MAG: helix-turn-helix domain-containing protein [Myxococcales bacterium]